jgi:hypothetical protein
MSATKNKTMTACAASFPGRRWASLGFGFLSEVRASLGVLGRLPLGAPGKR